MLVPYPGMEELKTRVAQVCSSPCDGRLNLPHPPWLPPWLPAQGAAEGDPWGHPKSEGPCRRPSTPVTGADAGGRAGAREPPRRTVPASAAGEPYTAGNWHQMLLDLPHPPGSWKHLFV